MSEERDRRRLEDRDPFKGEHCPNCDQPLDEPINDIWKDTNVKAALREGRSPDDIAVLSCPKCGRYGYYNQGSGFWCRFCKVGFIVLSEDESASRGIPSVRADEAVTLADTVTETTDGYNNETRPRS